MPLRNGQSRVRRQRYKTRERGLVARFKSVERGYDLREGVKSAFFFSSVKWLGVEVGSSIVKI
jgi:hypothetical protein